MSEPDGLYNEALLIFFDEAREMLQTVEDDLFSLDDFSDARDAIHSMFRSAHTIKGTSGIFSLHRTVNFTHQVESVLDRVRKGALAIDADLRAALFSSFDMIALLLAQAERHTTDVDELAAADQAAMLLTQRLAVYLDVVPHSVTASATASAQAPVKPAAVWHMSIRFHARTFQDGFDPLTVIDYLGKWGNIIHIHTVENQLTDWDGFDPEQCYLGFEIRIDTAATQAELESAFEFVTEDCDLHLVPPTRRAADFIELINKLPQERKLGDILVACGSVTREALDLALLHQQELTQGQPAQAGQALGEILVAQKTLRTEVLDAALERQSKMPGNRQDGGLFVRVPADKLDELINLVGELVICGASASLQAAAAKKEGLIATTEQLSRLVEEIRDGTLGLRMVRIGETFVRYRRVVHDVSAELGKSVSLVIHGADTELDKSVVEKIGDPLMHLVRNSLDHGIELPADRLSAGKPSEGTICLLARHDSGNIVIQVSDDGKGLDAENLLLKAREKGLVSDTQILTEAEKFELIFAPGFSTAEKVTNLSGRGVGMDVVRKNIEALRGSVKISSHLGQGTTIEIRLPLTLAIIDGFLVKIGAGSFVIPLHAVLECIDADPALMNMNQSCAGFIRLRSEILPLLDLFSVFACPASVPVKRRIVVVQGTAGKAGLIVDELQGEYQTVIKPLGKLFRHLNGISGSTVLGTGEVALILDVGSLVKLAIQPKNEDAIGSQRLLMRDLSTMGMNQTNLNREP